MVARIDQLITAGTFSLDGGTWDVENNVWIIGDDTECIVFDAAHDADAILKAIGSAPCAASTAPMPTTITSAR
ncbi:glyoxylase-like metal-dependent hydrolase (beta-lactamase superfamily II) [Cryobacterium sp. CG_9.6]|nr:glyoxylase-like metal-dependent hydrolase (beta-lactamase superfamily II) [Cryobacterium sp. CG_9.6]